MNKTIRIVLQTLLFLGIGAAFIYWSVRGLTSKDWQLITESILQSRYMLIVPVFFILIFSHYIRAVRWKMLIVTLGYRPNTGVVFFTVMIGYLANQALPRVGEILRCTLLARYENIPFEKLIGTILLERFFDLICLLIVIGLTFLSQPHLFNQLMALRDTAAGTAPASSGMGWYLVLGIGLAIIIWMIVKKKNPFAVLTNFRAVLRKLWEGARSFKNVKNKPLFFLHTIIIWAMYYLAGYVGLYAMQETEVFGIPEALSILLAGSLGMLVSPGGIGAYQFLIQKTMESYGLSVPIAVAYGWLLWLAFTSVVLVGGVISLLILPAFHKRLVTKRNKNKIAL